jgi:hypothetical protein
MDCNWRPAIRQTNFGDLAYYKLNIWLVFNSSQWLISGARKVASAKLPVALQPPDS